MARRHGETFEVLDGIALWYLLSKMRNYKLSWISFWFIFNYFFYGLYMTSKFSKTSLVKIFFINKNLINNVLDWCPKLDKI